MSEALKRLKQAGRGLVRTAVRAMPGGALISAGVGAVGALSARSRPRPGAGVFTGNSPGIDIGDVGDFIRRVAPGGATGRGRMAPAPNGKCPTGYHPARDGRGCVKNRRMNPANGRAIRRAVRRLRSAEKTFRRVLQVQGKPSTGIKPKRGKR